MIRASAWVVAVSHAAIALVGGLVLAPGSPGAADLATRMAYVAEHATAWRMAWLVPMLAAISLVWFTAAARARLAGQAPDLGIELAPWFVVLGAAIEITASCLGAAALPLLAQRGASEPFAALESAVQFATSAIGNLGFTLGQYLVTRALAQAGAPRWPVHLGYATVVAGVAFIALGLVGASRALPVATGLLFVCLCSFTIAVARAEWTRKVLDDGAAALT